MEATHLKVRGRAVRGVLLAGGLSLALAATLLLVSCADRDTTSAAQDSSSATTGAAVTEAEEVVVGHPYHSEIADAPNYLEPKTVSLAPSIRLAAPPPFVPAQRLVLGAQPAADLALRPSPADPTELMWWSSEEEPLETRLGNQEVAVESATSFLKTHGFWLAEWTEAEVTVGSRVVASSVGKNVGESPERITSWIVRFAGHTVVRGISRSVSVRIGHENGVVDLSLRLPELQPLAGKIVRLRSLEDILQDRQAWKTGKPDQELQEKASGPVDVVVHGYELIYEKPLSAEGDFLAVPVYEFQVELRSGDFGVLKGTWRVVAAAQTHPPAYRGGTASTSASSPEGLSRSLTAHEHQGGLVWVRPVPAGTDRDVWVGTVLTGEVTDPSELPPIMIGLRPSAGGRVAVLFERILADREDLEWYLNYQEGLLRLLVEEQPQEVITGTVTFSPKLQPDELKEMLSDIPELELFQVHYDAGDHTGAFGVGDGMPPQNDPYDKDWYWFLAAGVRGPPAALNELRAHPSVASIDLGAIEEMRHLRELGYELWLVDLPHHLARDFEMFRPDTPSAE